MRNRSRMYCTGFLFFCGLWAGCGPTAKIESTEITLLRSPVLPRDPTDPQWEKMPSFTAKLLLQDLVEPRLLDPSTAAVSVKGVTNGVDMMFRLQWADSTMDDRYAIEAFSDACAIQFLNEQANDLPAPQMGEDGRSVEITYWNACWQAIVNGRGDSLRALYPNSAIDHYPFQTRALAPGSAEKQQMAMRYAPARALGNDMGGPRQQPVQDLVAEGPGSLRPASLRLSQGTGSRSAEGWMVVISRPLTASLKKGGRSHIALAIWDGHRREVGARKMRTGWIPTLIKEGL